MKQEIFRGIATALATPMELDGAIDYEAYVPYADCHPEATGGFTEQAGDFLLEVSFPPALLAQIPASQREALLGVLAHDPFVPLDNPY